MKSIDLNTQDLVKGEKKDRRTNTTTNHRKLLTKIKKRRLRNDFIKRLRHTVSAT